MYLSPVRGVPTRLQAPLGTKADQDRVEVATVQVEVRLRSLSRSYTQLLAKHDTYHIDTSNILFILSGAFVGLDSIVRRRVVKGVSSIVLVYVAFLMF